MRMLWVKCVSFEQKAEFFSSQKKGAARRFVFTTATPKGRGTLAPAFSVFFKSHPSLNAHFCRLAEKTARRFAFTVRLAEKKPPRFSGRHTVYSLIFSVLSDTAD